MGRVTLQPLPDDVVVELLGPEKAPERLAHDELGVVGEVRRNDAGLERIRLAPIRPPLLPVSGPVDRLSEAHLLLRLGKIRGLSVRLGHGP
jgi:hypothetical protein